MLSQWHVKDPSSSAKSAGGRIHLNTRRLLTQRSRTGLTMLLSRHSVGTYQGNELSRNSSGNARPQSSQLAEPMWTDPSLKSGTGVHEPISTEKRKTEKRRRATALDDSHSRTRLKKKCKLCLLNTHQSQKSIL